MQRSMTNYEKVDPLRASGLGELPNLGTVLIEFKTGLKYFLGSLV